ncbi:MAG: M28 family peptidase, partial [Phycisphaerae bacterium]|nr:M28 family peptidase [Phycisphaerae bacterium]
MMRSIERVVGDRQPRLVNTPAAAAGRERIAALFAEAGVVLEPQSIHLERSRSGAINLTNLVGRIAGTDPSAGAIAVVSHSDSVRVSPGAGDAAAGVVAVAEVAHALKDRPARHDVVVLITDGEEAGLLGAEVFMR